MHAWKWKVTGRMIKTNPSFYMPMAVYRIPKLIIYFCFSDFVLEMSGNVGEGDFKVSQMRLNYSLCSCSRSICLFVFTSVDPDELYFKLLKGF